MLSDEERLTVVNVVASTRVAEELDLPDIAIQLNCEYEPEQFPGVVYRVVDPKLAILMFRSGRAVCTGGKNEQNIHTGIERMTADLRAAGIDTWDLKDVEIEVQNMVATYSLFYPEDYYGTARMDDNNTRVIDLEDGGIRAATDEEVEANDEYKMIGTPFTFIQQSIGIKKGNPEILDFLNSFISKLIKEGFIENLLKKHKVQNQLSIPKII